MVHAVRGRARLSEWIQRRALTHQAAADELGFTRPFITLLLSGMRRPSLEVAFRIQHVTGIPAESWVSTDGDETEHAVAHSGAKSRSCNK